jgi:hypothetical protein
VRGIYVETRVHADLDELWRLTQDPAQHVRWDLRFSSIEPLDLDEQGRQTFRYSLRLPGRTVSGRGVSVGERRRDDGTRTSALRFGSDDPLSPIRDGSGYWRYVPTADGIRFLTGYDFRPGWGARGSAVQKAVMQPVMWWLTARSFDALRIWLEHGIPPERTHRRGLADLVLRAGAVGVAVAVGRRRSTAYGVLAGAAATLAVVAAPAPDVVPRAGRCLREPPDAASARPPETLDTLPENSRGLDLPAGARC